MTESFDGQVVMVTGAAGALGSAVARAFADGGAALVLVGHRQQKLDEKFGDLGGAALLLAGDLTQAAQVEAVVAQAIDRFGRIDALVNIAGGFAMDGKVHSSSPDTWQRMLDLNARTVFLTCRAVIPQMLQQGRGKIVNTASMSAIGSGGARMAAYVVAKAAVVRLTEALAAEYRRQQINVNCILPGTIDTPANRQAMAKADHSRWTPPEEIAPVVLFLCSEAARAIHGAALPVGGQS